MSMSAFASAVSAIAGAAVSVTVSATKGIIGLEFSPDNCYARVTVHSNGDLYEYTGTSTSSIGTSYETYLDSGSSSNVWVQRTLISGTLYEDPGTARYNCGTNRTWASRQTGTGNNTAVIDLDFYDVASGGTSLDTQRVTLKSEVQSF